MANARVSQEAIEVAASGVGPDARVSQEVVETAASGVTGDTRVSQEAIEVASSGIAGESRVSQEAIEVLVSLCGTPSINTTIECASGTGSTVTICLSVTEYDSTFTVINPETLVATEVPVAVGGEECVVLELSCGQEWEIEILLCDQPYTTVAVPLCECMCPTPLDIKGFTHCRSGGLLGDGQSTRVVLLTRGGTSAITELKPDSGEFTRALDETSRLTMEGTVGGRVDESCCDGWEEIRTWATEIMVVRDGRDAWVGPVTDIAFEYGRVRVEADDLSAWWDRRTIPTLTFLNEDMTAIFEAIHEQAMAPDNSMNMILRSELTGVTGDRSYNGNTYMYAGDAIRELSDTGLDWTAYSRYIIVGGEEVDAQPYVTLMDEHWTEPPIIRDRGNEQATVVVVKGSGVQAVALAPDNYIDYYGYLVRVFEEPDILDQGSCNLAAQTRVDLLKDPQFIETPVGASLKTTAPVTVEQLIPGMRIRVDTQSTCRDVIGDFRLQRVTVDLSGPVAIDLQPLGFVSEALES